VLILGVGRSLHSYAPFRPSESPGCRNRKEEIVVASEKVRNTYPSLRSVVREVGVTVGYLQYRFPIIAKRIAKGCFVNIH